MGSGAKNQPSYSKLRPSPEGANLLIGPIPFRESTDLAAILSRFPQMQQISQKERLSFGTLISVWRESEDKSNRFL